MIKPNPRDFIFTQDDNAFFVFPDFEGFNVERQRQHSTCAIKVSDILDMVEHYEDDNSREAVFAIKHGGRRYWLRFPGKGERPEGHVTSVWIDLDQKSPTDLEIQVDARKCFYTPTIEEWLKQRAAGELELIEITLPEVSEPSM